MKKFLKIFGIVILCLATLTGGLAIWQRDNIKAIITGLRYSEEELSEMMTDAQNELKEVAKNFTETEIRDFTEEERQQIALGEVSAGEIIAKIITEATSQSLNQNSHNQQLGNDSDGKTTDMIISEHVAKLYSLKSSYIGQIDTIMAQGESEYYSMAAQGKAAEARKTLLSKYMGKLSSLEGACDSEVDSVISSLTNELKARNHSLDVIKTIRSAYANEKSIKKAQLIKKYS